VALGFLHHPLKPVCSAWFHSPAQLNPFPLSVHWIHFLI
jgi:hypothetical protein